MAASPRSSLMSVDSSGLATPHGRAEMATKARRNYFEAGECNRATLHVVSSLDGFIARKDNSVSWLDAKSTGGSPDNKSAQLTVVTSRLHSLIR